MRTLVKKRIAGRKKQVSHKTWKRMFLVDELDLLNVRVHELDARIKEVLATLGIENEYLQIRAAAEKEIDASKLNAAVDRANSLIEATETDQALNRETPDKTFRKRDKFRFLKV